MGEIPDATARTERSAGSAPWPRLGPARLAAGFAWNALFCAGVAALLWQLGISPFRPALLVSLAIGMAIKGAFVLGHDRLETRIGPWLAPAVLLAVGVLAGVLLGGALAYGDPLHLFVAAPATLGLGLAFGIVGYLVLGTRARLLKSRLRIAELERSRAAQARDLAATRLKLLQAQIEPHFLFNALGNVQSLIGSDPERAEHLLGQLTRLLRRSLQRSRDEEARLADEFDQLRAYLEIQRVRMDDRLRYRLELDPDAARLALPPLLIQPLVENAIVHGLEPKAGPGALRVCATLRDDHLRITVRDDGIGFDGAGASGRAGTGTGLANVRARLAERYGAAAALRLADAPGGGAIVSLTLPVPAPAKDREAPCPGS